jgi:hypothetical protein
MKTSRNIDVQTAITVGLTVGPAYQLAHYIREAAAKAKADAAKSKTDGYPFRGVILSVTTDGEVTVRADGMEPKQLLAPE